MRDDFTQSTKDILARRVNFLCSNPNCPLGTVGPHSEPGKYVNNGVAAHITAASAGGKRFDNSLTSEQRCSPENGIWLCQNCAKLVDSDETQFTVELLREWKVSKEARTAHSMLHNSPLIVGSHLDQVRVRVSYVGGKEGTHIDINIFNGSQSPVFLSFWYAEWADRRTMNSSRNCIRGKLPFRLQAQDIYELVVDLGSRGFTDLKMIGVIDGNDQRVKASEVNIATVVHQAKRYSVLHVKQDTTELEARLRKCEVAIEAAIEQSGHGHRLLAVKVVNNSMVPIPLAGAAIEWKYDPPRSPAPDHDSARGLPRIQEAGGSITLSSSSDLESALAPGATARFHVHPATAVALIETLFEDVNDHDISIVVGTTTRIKWRATDDGIPEAVRAYARHIVEDRNTS